MIKINELRIGNSIAIKKGLNEIEKVFAINLQDREVNFLELDQVKPIKLTTEVLEKCGWYPEGSEAGDDGAMEWGDDDARDDYIFTWVPQVGRYMNEESLGLWIRTNYGHEQISVPLKRVQYLHQLQNIIYDFTGKKLKYESKSKV